MIDPSTPRVRPLVSPISLVAYREPAGARSPDDVLECGPAPGMPCALPPPQVVMLDGPADPRVRPYWGWFKMPAATDVADRSVSEVIACANALSAEARQLEKSDDHASASLRLREAAHACEKVLENNFAFPKLAETLREAADTYMSRALDALCAARGRHTAAVPSEQTRYGELRTALSKAECFVPHVTLASARASLDATHFGLTDVKQRILEEIAVLKRRGQPSGRAICLVGAPGVGKTSITRSIAAALGWPFAKVALGGVRDEVHIRGHHRGYANAQPGRIVTAMQRAKCLNPVILLDEIDKVVQDGGHGGSPADALLEVLDESQNKEFSDHFLGDTCDLSHVLFICTANDADKIPEALRDRLEIIHIRGYTLPEKREMARANLIPKALEEHGLGPASVVWDDDAITEIITGHTREAGVRDLQRNIASICRKLVMHLEGGQTDACDPVDVAAVHRHLGAASSRVERAASLPQVGVAYGLGVDVHGGSLLRIQGNSVVGTGKITWTGKLGEVMRESVTAAHHLLKSGHAVFEGAQACGTALRAADIHIHIPAGSRGKEGPSAGAAVMACLVSLGRGIPLRQDVAMTGEIDLQGRILPVGGISDKAIAAVEAGMQTLVAPRGNHGEIEELPAWLRQRLRIVEVDTCRAALAEALMAQGLPVEPVAAP